jgi:hypothetical protein
VFADLCGTEIIPFRFLCLAGGMNSQLRRFAVEKLAELRHS